MGKTFSLAMGTIKKITDKPLSGCRRLFSRMHKCTRPVTSSRTTPRQRTIEDMPEAHAAEIHPVQMTKILRDVFQDPQLAHKYAKHLDKKVEVGSFVSQEPEIDPIQKAPPTLRTRNVFPEVVREGSQPTSCNSWISGIRFVCPY